MSIKKYVLIAFAVVAVVLVVSVFIAGRKFFSPTHGVKISKYANPGKALLVIDVQEDYTGLKGKQPALFKNVEKPINTINTLIDSASRKGFEVVYIRQVFDDGLIANLLGGRSIEGRPGAEMDARIKRINQNDFTKKISDSFSNPRLEEFLIKNQVDEIYLVGLDAAGCVYNTAMGGLNRGYKVKVVRDAVMTLKNMSDVLKRYEKEGILVTSSKEIIGM